jgi:NAD(P) transhydrogenase subunit alpha
LLLYLTKDGALAIDTDDEVQAGIVIAHDGRVVHKGVAALLVPRGQTPAELLPEGGADVDGPSD